MLIAVRHGATKFNDNGGKGAEPKEKFRGWLPIPLNLEGMAQAHETAELLAQAEDIEHIYSSDLVRAVQTAEEIGQALSMEIEPREELRDWNIGDYVGRDVKEVIKDVLDFIDHPLKAASNGESYQFFLDRCIPFLRELVESDDINIGVTHARVVGLIKALSVNKGEYPDTATLKKKAPIEPGEIMIVDRNWKIVYQMSKEKDAE
jgi:broad specificity phosphatase PhoE